MAGTAAVMGIPTLRHTLMPRHIPTHQCIGLPMSDQRTASASASDKITTVAMVGITVAMVDTTAAIAGITAVTLGITADITEVTMVGITIITEQAERKPCISTGSAILRAVMSEKIGERHASACRYKNEVQRAHAAPLTGLISDREENSLVP